MANQYEAEVIIGIEDIAVIELKSLQNMDLPSIEIIRAGFIRFIFTGKEQDLLKLRSVIAIYSIHNFDIPRPKAILGHQNFTHLTRLINNQLQNWNNPTTTFGIGAAGSNSSVFERIKHELSQTLGLDFAEDGKGELFLRFIPHKKESGWQVLIRLSQRPLSARPWRIQNIPGALNATVAYAMTHLANITCKNHIINLCSGTDTILIEQSHSDFEHQLIALDNDHLMLESATTNIRAAEKYNSITQILGDAQQTPFKSGQFDVIYADLPFGHHIGSHDTNEWLYPAILSESARIAKDNAVFVAITHEINLFDQSVTISDWTITQTRQINLSGLHPQIFVLERN